MTSAGHFLQGAAFTLLAAAVWTAGFSVAAPPPFAAFNVRDFGAKGDGVTLDTAALNRAIDACSAAGGGTVHIPPGTYLSGTLHLKSRVTLWLDSGATILGSKNLADYHDGEVFYGALLRGADLDRVAIIGQGSIDGNDVFNPKGQERIRGPHGLYLLRCRDFTVRDITVKNAGNWATVFIGCRRGNIDGISAFGGSDGIHMQYTKDVTIANCRLFTGDDSLAGLMWENVTVTNCILNTSCHALRVGGRNVAVSNCLVYGPGAYPHRSTARHNTMSAILHLGVRPPTAGVKPGEEWRELFPSDNIMLSGLTIQNVRSPFYMESRACCNTYPDGPPSVGLKKIFVHNLTAIDAGRLPFAVDGHPESRVESVVLNDVRLAYEGGITAQHADGYSIDPVSGLYFNNVDHVELHNVRIDFKQKDARPVLMAENVKRLEIDRLAVPHAPENYPVYVLEKVGEVLVGGKPAPAAAAQIRGLEADLSRTGGKAIVGEPFNAVVSVENTGAEGLAEVRLRFRQESFSRSVWLGEKQTRQVLFANLRCTAPGDYAMAAGRFQKTVRAEAMPAPGPVAAPYSTFANVKAEFARLSDALYLVAAETYAYHLHMIGGADRYAAAYQKGSLPENAAVSVRVDKVGLPDHMKRFDGRTGIMVRNDISRPDQSLGYVVLDSSISYGGDRQWSNGWSMQWDSDGDGRIDQHTEYAGYTLWPHWLKLERRGGKYTGYYSLDGTSWNKVAQVAAPGAKPVQDAGVYVTWAGGRFSDFRIAELAP